jgi:predicted transporter
MPDFAQVYNFIGSVFDPNSTNHLQRLKQMDPINVETVIDIKSFLCLFTIIFSCSRVQVHGLERESNVCYLISFLVCPSYLHGPIVQALLLMRNLSINLTSPEFEDHVSFISARFCFFSWHFNFTNKLRSYCMHQLRCLCHLLLCYFLLYRIIYDKRYEMIQNCF